MTLLEDFDFISADQATEISNFFSSVEGKKELDIIRSLIATSLLAGHQECTLNFISNKIILFLRFNKYKVIWKKEGYKIIWGENNTHHES